MKLFKCTHCGNLLYFENRRCEQCGYQLGFVSQALELFALESAEIYFEQFTAVRQIMTSILKEEWTWLLHATDDSGKTISRIYTELTPVNIFVRDDWPVLISFFKPRIIALDEFWNEVKYGFETLQ